jgi:mannosyl-oligosaccharide alpha-1,2-mannosidase
MDHLVCFLAGALAEGVAYAPPAGSKGAMSQRRAEAHLELATQLAGTCHAMYAGTATGLAPEIAHFRLVGRWVGGLVG